MIVKNKRSLGMASSSIVVIVFSIVCSSIIDRALAQYDEDLRGDYCRHRYPQSCCPGRDDTCTAPILGTLCYCDTFCNRTSAADCCPDFWEVCFGIPPPPQPIVRPECLYKGRYYKLNEVINVNCNKCTCTQKGPTSFELSCQQNVCLIRQELIESVNRSPYGWRASNYTDFWGETLQDGFHRHLGTFKPIRPTSDMFEIHSVKNGPLPDDFDARHRWPNLLQDVRDQGNCASSWAVSTIAVASDRLAIESLGLDRSALSVEHLLSCQKRGQRGCQGGHLDKAWYYLRKHGVTTEACFPYTSGIAGVIPQCPFKNGQSSNGLYGYRGRCIDGSEPVIYQAPPPYKVGPKEEDIMREIYFNGPVQATIRVHEDFFLYKSGVYNHQVSLTEGLSEGYRQNGYHSVRILGWGVEKSGTSRPQKYWLCSNSWGRHWGEDGLFRIKKGENECEIEMFVVGVWAKLKRN